MKAIPTRYKGVQFRSRIEARWAVMFDLLEWPWEYEPIDLEGYIPDFILMFPAGGVLVEVKAIFGVKALIAECAAKIDQSGWESKNLNDALIVGATWDHGDRGQHYDFPCLGAIRQCVEQGWLEDGEEHVETFADWCAAEWIRCRSCGHISTYHFQMGWACSYCGTPGKIYGEPPYDLQAYWAEAGNAVQWKPRR